MCIKINRKVAFLISTVGRKSQNMVVTPPPPPYFLSLFFKTFVTHPPKINELDTVVTPTPVLRPLTTPQNLERAPTRHVGFPTLFFKGG